MVFRVATKATKPEIKAAVEALFNVKVTAVNTLNRAGKNKRFRGIRGQAEEHQKSSRDAGRRPVDRRDDRPLGGTTKMALKTYNPTTPGRRQLTLVDRSHLWKGKPKKELTEGLNKTGGRNNLGRLTARRRGGGHKRSYRIVDFKRRKFDMPATVERLEYDPNRSAFIALISYDGRRDLLHHRAAAPGGGRHDRLRRAGRREAGQRHAASRHPGRHDRAQRRAQDRQRRPARARRRLLRADRRPRPGLRDPAG